MVEHVHHEMALHVEYCKGFDITKAKMEASQESQGMCEPTRYDPG
jgi:thiaminase